MPSPSIIFRPSVITLFHGPVAKKKSDELRCLDGAACAVFAVLLCLELHKGAKGLEGEWRFLLGHDIQYEAVASHIAAHDLDAPVFDPLGQQVAPSRLLFVLELLLGEVK